MSEMMNKQARRLLAGAALVALWVAVPSSAPAQEPHMADLTEMSLEDLLDIVVSSASKEAEPLSETPVPVTVITSEMIREIGAKNLMEALVAYVPGLTFVQDHNEMNVAMRGVYASSQQKILIMQDGHRLNARAYSEANPDYSIGLDKVEQIEVLRGPASSLYGNVSLTAVINLVTKKGRDMRGLDATVGMGNYGQTRYSALYGKEFEEGEDLVLWGTAYRADGEKVSISPDEDYSSVPSGGAAIVDGIDDPASYDVGLRYLTGPWSLLAAARHCKYIEPFSAGGVTGETYEYDRYRKYMGTGPGLGSTFRHLNLSYDDSPRDDIDLHAGFFYDRNEIHVMLVIDPSIEKYGLPQWRETDMGFRGHVRKHHDWKGVGSGTVLFGVELDAMKLTDSAFPLGQGGEFTAFADNEDVKVLETGEEIIYSGYSQLKQRVGDRYILNLGLRYDTKNRHDGPSVSDVSPRLALIYIPDPRFNLKMSYSQSFVDAPYWYRYNSLASYRGARDLEPEHLTSFQVTPTVTLWDGRITNVVNLFYNHLTDFIYRDNSAADDEPIYRNAGMLKSWGVEEELALIGASYRLRMNFTYQEAVDSKDYGVQGSRIDNVPSFTANTILAVKPLPARNAWLDVSTRYIGSQLSPIQIVFKDGDGNVKASYEEPFNEVDEVWLVGTGVRLDDFPRAGWSLGARVNNLLDEEYEQGGSVLHPYPQAGRWYMIQATAHF